MRDRSPWAPGQHQRHQHEDAMTAEQRRAEARSRTCRRCRSSARHERAADRADAADHRHDERENEDRLAHADLHGGIGPAISAGKARQRRAQPEHERVEKPTSTPSARTIARLVAPARTSMPMRVWTTRT